jgi:protein involved in polysaccharide export with SLBB domain
MRLMQRLAGPLVLFALSAAVLISIDPVYGQNSGSSVEQILQGLSQDQLGSISQQLPGAGTGGANGTGTTNRMAPINEAQQNLMLQQQRDMVLEQQRQRAELQRLSPFLQGEDWVVITVDSNPLPAGNQPPPNAPQVSALGALGGVTTPQQQNLLGNLAPGLGGSQSALAQSAGAAGAAGGGGANAANNPASGVAAATAAAMSPSAAQNVTAGGYALLPPNCGGQPNCDPTQPMRPDMTDEEKKQRDRLIDLIRSKNPYQLSRDGVLTLPGFVPIPLAGLTEQLATLRLGVEPALKDLFIRVTKLPLAKQGPTALKPFGYDLFDRQISTFAPATDVPVPASYVIGPGDELDLELYGSKNKTFRLTVARDGRVSVPELGPINVAGQTFESAKALIESRIERGMIGVHASVTMGDTRSIKVFVLGDAKWPGAYTISGLGTITSALFAAGGVQPIGSLRNIQLKRHGELVRRLDLYDMMIRGDTTDDARLLPDDVIFIPPVGPTVSVDGEVHRPAIYEIRNESSIADVVQLAGGFTAEADTAKLALTRIDANLHRVVLQVDLMAGAAKSQAVRNGDSLRVSRLRPTLDAGVTVQGYVYTPGAFAYRDGMRLSDVLRSVDDLKPNADLHYILIRRELPPDRRVTVLSADLAAALRDPGSAADLPLMARDRITVFDLQSSRDRVIRPLLDDLKLQSNIGLPEDVVRIDGRANVPGEYPYQAGMTVSDLIRAGGGLSDAAFGGTAELTRYNVVNGESRHTELIRVDLAALLRGDPAANLTLEPFDSLSIKEVQQWTDQETITLRGQVKYPGRYSVKPGETLKSVLLRAGGLTQYAFAEGSVFTRLELRDREQKELDMLAARMQNDIAFVALQASNVPGSQGGAASALAVGQSLISQLRQARAVGRLVINVPRMLRSPIGSPYDVVLRDGDELLVPKYEQEVTVIGEVQTATSHLFRPGLSRDDYIAMSGGETRRADHGRIYVVRADGSVVAHEGERWYSTGNGSIEPGDTIVVPLNAEHMPPLPLWQAVSQILYNVAIAVLAVHEF